MTETAMQDDVFCIIMLTPSCNLTNLSTSLISELSKYSKSYQPVIAVRFQFILVMNSTSRVSFQVKFLLKHKNSGKIVQKLLENDFKDKNYLTICYRQQHSQAQEPLLLCFFDSH